MLTLEQELLVCCARLRLDPARSLRVRELLARPLDFEALLRSARVHGMLPFLGRHLLAADGDILPPSAREQLRHAVREIAARNASLTAELLRTLTLLRATGILAVPFKGPVAALTAYGNVGLRQFSDLDILVSPEDLDAAAGVLVDAGYRALDCVAASHTAVLRRTEHHHEFRHSGSGTVIELHWRFGPSWFHFPLDLPRLSERLTRLSLAGEDVPVLGPEDTLLILCAHGSKHLWARLEWICLVAEFIRRHDAIDWSELVSRASAVGARRFVGLGLRLAQDVVGLQMIPEPARSLSSDPAVRSLADDFTAQLFRAGGNVPGPWTIAVGIFRARERLRDRLRQVIGLTLEPTITEVTTLNLPRQLAWFYYLARPVRLTWKYGVATSFRGRAKE